MGNSHLARVMITSHFERVSRRSYLRLDTSPDASDSWPEDAPTRSSDVPWLQTVVALAPGL